MSSDDRKPRPAIAIMTSHSTPSDVANASCTCVLSGSASPGIAGIAAYATSGLSSWARKAYGRRMLIWFWSAVEPIAMPHAYDTTTSEL